MSDPTQGSVVNGRYKILERIGTGGMSSVFRALDQLQSAEVALKILSRDFLERNPREAERNLRRFKREAEILRMLDGSAYVVGYVEHACSAQGDWFIAMELLVGEPLRHYMRKGNRAMPLRTFVHYAQHLVLGLKEIHQHRILHRDLAPDNVILVKGADGRRYPKFLDFGIGKSLDNALDQVTQMLTIMGKPSYISPEQARGLDLTPASDVYSLGVLLYQMCTGHVPLDIRGIPDFKRIQSEPPVPLIAHAEGRRVPEDIQNLIMGCLAKFPEDRPHLDEMLASLEETHQRLGDDDPLISSTNPSAPIGTDEPDETLDRELKPGEPVNRYIIRSVIGRGGMGTVYEAWDPDLRRKVALKVATSVEEERAKKRVLHEARASAALRSENIVTIYDAGTDDGIPFIAMEYVDGKTLAQIIDEEGHLTGDRFWTIARGICQGLMLAHDREHPVIHRDLKPSNILLHGQVAKIADFGMAKVTNTASTATVGDTGHDLGGGTVATMSPEQINEEPIDHRTDLYSLGCVLFMMATGRAPFQGNHMAIVYQHCHAEPPQPSQFQPGLPPALDELVVSLLQKEPDLRPPSVSAVLDELRRIYAPEEAARPRRRAAILFTALGVALFAGGGLAVRQWMRWESEIRVNSVAGREWEPGSMTYVSRPEVEVVVQGLLKDATIVSTKRGGGTPAIRIPLPNGSSDPVSVPVSLGDTRTDKFSTHDIEIQDADGRAVAPFTVVYDPSPPEIQIKRGDEEIPVSSDGAFLAVVAPGQTVELRIRDLDSGIAELSGTRQSQGFPLPCPPDTLPPWVQLAQDSAEGDWVYIIAVSNLAGGRTQASVRISEMTPTLTPVSGEQIHTRENEVEIAFEISFDGMQNHPDLLQAAASALKIQLDNKALEEPLIVRSDGRLAAVVKVPGTADQQSSVHAIRILLHGSIVSRGPDIRHDVEPPRIALHHQPLVGPVRDYDNGTEPSAPLSKYPGQSLNTAFRVIARDDGALSAVEVAYDAGPWQSALPHDWKPTSQNPPSISLPPLPDQDLTRVRIRATDLAENTSQLEFGIQAVAAQVTDVRIDSGSVYESTLFVSHHDALTIGFQALGLGEPGQLELELVDDHDVVSTFPCESLGDGRFIARGVNVTDAGTGLARRRVRIVSRTTEPRTVLSELALVVDSASPTTSVQFAGRPFSGSDVRVGRFHPLEIAVRDAAGNLTSDEAGLQVTLDGEVQQGVSQRVIHRDGFDLIVDPERVGRDRPGHWRIQYQAQDRSGNTSPMVEVSIHVAPPQMEIVKINGFDASEPPLRGEGPWPVADGTLRLELRNGAGRGTFSIDAVITGSDGTLREYPLGQVSGDTTQAFTIAAAETLSGAGGTIGLRWSDVLDLDPTTPPPVPTAFRKAQWKQDRFPPSWEVERGPSAVPSPAVNGVYALPGDVLILRLRDDLGFPEEPLVKQGSGFTLTARDRKERQLEFVLQAESPKGQAAIDLLVTDLAGRTAQIAFPLRPAQDHPVILPLLETVGRRLGGGQPKRYAIRDSNLSLDVSNPTISVDGVEVRVRSQDEGKEIDRLSFTLNPGSNQTVSLQLPSLDNSYVLSFHSRQRGAWGDLPFDSITVGADREPPFIELRRDGSPLTPAQRESELSATSLIGLVFVVKDNVQIASADWVLVPSAEGLTSAKEWAPMDLDHNGVFRLPLNEDLRGDRWLLWAKATDWSGNKLEFVQTIQGTTNPSAKANREPIPSLSSVQERTRMRPLPIGLAHGPARFFLSETEVTLQQFGIMVRDLAPSGSRDEAFDEKLKALRDRLIRRFPSYFPKSSILLLDNPAATLAAMLDAVAAEKPDTPVCVPFDLAALYAVWAGGRLPTKVEWCEAAGHLVMPGARYPVKILEDGSFGSDLGLLRQPWAIVGTGVLWPVTKLTNRSPFGLLGMAGNTAEWVVLEKGTMGGSFRNEANNPTAGPAMNRPPHRPTDFTDTGIRVLWEELGDGN